VLKSLIILSISKQFRHCNLLIPVWLAAGINVFFCVTAHWGNCILRWDWCKYHI